HRRFQRNGHRVRANRCLVGYRFQEGRGLREGHRVIAELVRSTAMQRALRHVRQPSHAAEGGREQRQTRAGRVAHVVNAVTTIRGIGDEGASRNKRRAVVIEDGAAKAAARGALAFSGRAGVPAGDAVARKNTIRRRKRSAVIEEAAAHACAAAPAGIAGAAAAATAKTAAIGRGAASDSPAIAGPKAAYPAERIRTRRRARASAAKAAVGGDS